MSVTTSIKYLNLDPEFTPFGDSILFESFTFHGGEPHIRILEPLGGEDQVCMTSRIQSFNDLGLLLIANDALTRMGVKVRRLILPYFPGARQDRLMVEGEALTAKVYAELINAMELEEVVIFDPHSDVVPALLNNVRIVNNHKFVKQILKNKENYVLISPDGGALKKVYKLASFLGGVEVVECSKNRDVKTGKLTGFQVYKEALEAKTCVVVDDICDGGGTFVGLAQELKRKGASKLILVVSHGIFSKGTKDLIQCFDEIYTTNSFKTIELEGVNCVKLDLNLLS